MAKMGGREDLLRHRDPKPKPEHAVAYPRNDWFYLEDNRMEENNDASAKPWEFRLPEYMVHDEHKPFGDNYDYRNDPEGLIYWKKGRVVPGDREIKHVTRQRPVEQVHSAPPSQYQATRSAANRNQASEQQQRYPDVPAMYGDGRPAMNKLLAYGYQSEWKPARDQWYNQCQAMETAQRLAELDAYHIKPTKSGKSSQKNMMWNDMKSKTQPVNAARRVTSNTHQQADKAPFKLSKYDNVESKVNSHRVLPPIS